MYHSEEIQIKKTCSDYFYIPMLTTHIYMHVHTLTHNNNNNTVPGNLCYSVKYIIIVSIIINK